MAFLAKYFIWSISFIALDDKYYCIRQNIYVFQINKWKQNAEFLF